MRATRMWVVCVALGFVPAGCSDSGDEQTEVAITPQAPATVETTAPEPSPPTETPKPASTPALVASVPLPGKQRREIGTRAADTAAAVRRWDEQLVACSGPSGDGDDSGATCTHAAWERLVFQVEIAMYYLLDDLRAMPRGACHDALAAENDILRGFWHGAAPLNLAWLDEQQRPPSRFDLESAVALVRPVSGRIREAVTTVCAR